MNQRRKNPIRYMSLSDGDIIATFPDGERYRLVLEPGVRLADVSGPHHLNTLRRLNTLLDGRDRVLIIGSADGFPGFVLSHQVREVTGVDWQEEWIRYASRRYRTTNLRFECRPVLDDQWIAGEFSPVAFDKIVVFNLLDRVKDIDRVERLLRNILGVMDGLPLLWSETLPDDEFTAERRRKLMADCLARLSRREFVMARADRELTAWPGDWPSLFELEPVSFDKQIELLEQVLNRVDGPLVFGTGIPEYWPGDFFLLDQEKVYGILRTEAKEALPLFQGQTTARFDWEKCEVLHGIEGPDTAPLTRVEEKNPRAHWWYAEGKNHRERLREKIRPELKNGYCAEGYELTDGRGMLVRIDRRERLPLYPLFDTTESLPKWSELSAYLDWTKKKSLITLNRKTWQKYRFEFQNQPHRGLLILKDFDETDIDTILEMNRQGWRIGLGANRPIDQVPLQSFEKFRLSLERNGITMEALWMGDMPPDPAYLHNIYSRFGRLLISTRSIQKSWDSKKVRFCLTIRSGDDSHARVQQAYDQMAGIDPLTDYLMLYRWASALEKAGLFQAARVLFTSLAGSRVPEELEPVRRRAGVFYHLGRIAEAVSAMDIAIRCYSRCLALDPGFHEAALRLRLTSVSQAVGRLDSR